MLETQRKTRVLVDLLDNIGGAPRSLSAQIGQLESNKFAVTITACELTEEIQRLVPPEARLMYAPRFPSKNLLGIFSTARSWMTLLNSESPDIIVSNRASQFRYISPIAAKLSIPLLIVIPGGEPTKAQLKATNDRIAVAYSIENVDHLLKSGYPKDNVILCSNRIELPCEVIKPKPVNGDELNIGIIGNLKRTTQQGLRSCIKFFYENASASWAEITVHFFGKNLLNSTDVNFDILLAPPNLGRPRNLRFVSHGWVNDIEGAIKPMDIVIGKGRSVLFGSMLEKPSFVLSEGSGVVSIDEDTVRSLQRTNFTGRQIESDYSSLYEVIYDRINLLKAQEKNTKVAEYIRKQYSAKGAGEVIEMAINMAIKHGKDRPITSGILGLLYSYSNALFDFFTRGK